MDFDAIKYYEKKKKSAQLDRNASIGFLVFFVILFIIVIVFASGKAKGGWGAVFGFLSFLSLCALINNGLAITTINEKLNKLKNL